MSETGIEESFIKMVLVVVEKMLEKGDKIDTRELMLGVYQAFEAIPDIGPEGSFFVTAAALMYPVGYAKGLAEHLIGFRGDEVMIRIVGYGAKRVNIDRLMFKTAKLIPESLANELVKKVKNPRMALYKYSSQAQSERYEATYCGEILG